MSIRSLDNEATILQGMAKGRHHAFDVVIAHYDAVLYSAALKWTRDAAGAQDVVQKVFMKLWISRASLGSVKNLGAYLTTAVRNECLNVMDESKRIRVIRMHMQEKYDRQAAAEDPSDGWEYKYLKVFDAAIDSLAGRQKAAYLLYTREGLSRKEVAQKMNISLESVKTHLKLARRKVFAFCRGRFPLPIVLLLTGRFF